MHPVKEELMRRSRFILIVPAVAFLLLVPMACRRGSDTPAELQAKAVAERFIESGSRGPVDVSALPVALRYPDAKALRHTSETDEGQVTHIYMFETRDQVADVMSWYKKNLPDWKQTVVMEQEASSTLTFESKDGDFLYVGAGRKTGKDQTVINLQFYTSCGC
jgi:hypothetical protein